MILLGASLTPSPGLGLQSGPWKFSPRARSRLAPASCSTPTRTQTTFKWDLCYSNVVVKECAAVSTWGSSLSLYPSPPHPTSRSSRPSQTGQSWPLVKKKKKMAWMSGSLLSEPLAGYVILVCGKELTKKKKKNLWKADHESQSRPSRGNDSSLEKVGQGEVRLGFLEEVAFC